MKKKIFVLCLIFLILIAGVVFVKNQKAHEFTLAHNVHSNLKSEQIQPLSDTISVSGDFDTDVVFTDIETDKTYTIGYITHGVSEKINLEKGKWYTVEGAGNITVKPVNVRIE